MTDVADQLILALNAFCNKYTQVTNKLFRTSVIGEMPDLEEIKPFLAEKTGYKVKVDLLSLINGLLTLSGKSKLATVLDSDNSTIIAFTWVKLGEEEEAKAEAKTDIAPATDEVPVYGEGIETPAYGDNP